MTGDLGFVGWKLTSPGMSRRRPGIFLMWSSGWLQPCWASASSSLGVGPIQLAPWLVGCKEDLVLSTHRLWLGGIKGAEKTGGLEMKNQTHYNMNDHKRSVHVIVPCCLMLFDHDDPISSVTLGYVRFVTACDCKHWRVIPPVGDAIGGHAHGAGGSFHHSWTTGGGSSWSSGGGGSFHHSWATGGSWNHSFNHSFNMSFNHSWSSGGGSFNHSWSSGGGSFNHSWTTGGAFNHSFNVSFNHSPVFHPSSSIKHKLGSSVAVATTDVGHSVLDLVSITTHRKNISVPFLQ